MKWVESGCEVNRAEPNPNDTCRERVQDLTVGRANESPLPTRLQPKEPPGQRTRKARRFGDEIRRLHAEGYSLESIRETLAEAGVVVSWSTVQREAARQAPAPPQRASIRPQPDLSAPAVSRTFGATAAVVEPPAAPPRQSGREVAEAFFQTHISNPLLRKDER
ncbi:hypothetical protein [Roseateles sp. LYH14W]|uniref:Resolvase HTH domain-containing protein n=1 Tax=Pelomonas parva TaxID=3299032 RepID=A0ABW7FCV7_9BURK